ncbi:MAG: 2-isopropylmalate synthase, partial [Candidatus Dadabacteria bacterium]
YQVKGISGGTDAVGDVSCLIRIGETAVRGHGSHTDIVVASALAFVDALNRYVYRNGGRLREDERVVGP